MIAWLMPAYDTADIAFFVAFGLACIGWFMAIRSCERPK